MKNLFYLLTLLGLLPSAQAQFTFTTNNGAITITGYNTAAGLNVVIPNTINGYPVTSIEDSAFIVSSMTNVTIGDNVTRIGNDAFNSSSITSVTIGNKVTDIGDAAFYNCQSLTSISIPGSVTNIASVLDGHGQFDVFLGCNRLTSIAVASSNPVFSSLAGALLNKNQTMLIQCPPGNMGSYTIPDSVTDIEDVSGFFQLTSITIGSGITNIFNSMFSGDQSLTNIIIPNSITSIDGWAFYNCSALKNLTLPHSVTSIGDDAFLACSALTSVAIPNSVTSIGNYAFGSCSSLTSVTIPDSVTSIGDNTFTACTSLVSVTIGKGVTSIGFQAFSQCANLFTITIPASVTNISGYAFAYCYALAEVYFQGNAPTIDPHVFQFGNSGLTVYHFPNTTGWDVAFGGFPTAITPLPAGVTSIGSLPVLFYPPAGTNYMLQISTNPASGNWVAVSNTVVFNALQVTNLANAAFFRLQAASGSVPSPTIVSYGYQPVWIYPTNATYSLQMKTNLASTNWLAATNGNLFISVQITNAPANAVFRLH